MAEGGRASARAQEEAHRELFGGYMHVKLPASFADVSDFRPVPDHQEVWSDPSTDISVIVEILEAVHGLEAETSAQFFFNDLARLHDAETSSEIEHVGLMGDAEAPGICQGATSMSKLTGKQRVAKHRDGPSAANVVKMHLANVRYVEDGTDILVTVNQPIAVHPGSSAAPDVGSGISAIDESVGARIFQRTMATLTLNDKALFAPHH